MDPKIQDIVLNVYKQSECGCIDKAVLECARLARLIEDHYNLFLFLRELATDKDQFRSLISGDVSMLSKDKFSYLWKRSVDEFCETHSLDDLYCEIGSDGCKKKVLNRTIGELLLEVTHFEEVIADYNCRLSRSYVAPDDLIDFGGIISVTRRRLLANRFIIDRVRNKCLNYASRVEGQAVVQGNGVVFLERVQANVNNYFARRSSAVYEKLIKACELVGHDDPESGALLLTAVRRAIKSVADFLYPPVQGDVVCLDGNKRDMGDGKYMNRLQEYCRGLMHDGSTVGRMLDSEVDYFVAFVKRVHDLSCKGVHDSVTFFEAKQGLVCFYMFLSTVVDRIQNNES